MDRNPELMSRFHRLSIAERHQRLKDFYHLDDEEMALLEGRRTVDTDLAENFIENVIGYYPMPMGVASHFRIDGTDLFVPMAVEETSIIAAASATAKWIKANGSIRTYSKGNLAIGQIQIPSVKDAARAREILHQHRDEILERANECVPGLVRRGGGVRDLALRTLPREDGQGEMLVIHVMVDPCDAMGANLINQVCEALKPKIEELTSETVGLCILSNLVDGRMAGAEVVVRNVDSEELDGIVEAGQFAETDPYRATTHNKGVLNGIDALLVATGNDWRAVEAGIHAYCSAEGRYRPVTQWRREGNDLVGRLEAPFAVGTVGGVTRSHPWARLSMRMLGVEHASDLARVCAAVGLVQNLGALRALSTVGIVNGHMKLHAANLALAAGAEVHEIKDVKERLEAILRETKHISLTHAKEVLESIRALR
jgi:hydroxymethylglutaryl-CoA reductase